MKINRMIYDALVNSKDKLERVNNTLEAFQERDPCVDLSYNLQQALTVAQRRLRAKKKGSVREANAALRVALSVANEIGV